MNDNHIFHKLEDLNYSIGILKEEYLSYIKDKEYSIDSRWNVFCEAPDAMKENATDNVHFFSLPDDFIRYDMPRHAFRRALVSVYDIVNCVDDYNDFELNESRLIDVNALKEEILSMNIGSFVFDW